METNSHYEKVIKAIAEQRNDVIDLCLQLGNTPSFHAQERKLGEAVSIEERFSRPSGPGAFGPFA